MNYGPGNYNDRYPTAFYPYYGMQYQMMNQQNYQQQQPPPQQTSQGLNGKIVDSEDIVKATEVPIGGYGIFPKADLSEIYIKSWNNNGTTSIITFKPIIEAKSGNEVQDLNTILLQKINLLEDKIDMVLNNKINKGDINTSLLNSIDKEAEVQKSNGF